MAGVEAGRMPPWQPSPDCRSYEGERIMSPADKGALRAWLDAGAPLGLMHPRLTSVLTLTARREERPIPPEPWGDGGACARSVPRGPVRDRAVQVLIGL